MLNVQPSVSRFLASIADSQKQCYHEGMRYNTRQVWEVSMKKQNGRHNNCAECICYVRKENKYIISNSFVS